MKRLALGTVALAVYLAATGALAACKPLWFDELFTWHLCQFSDLGQLWQNLLRGFDPNPPLAYVLSRAGRELLGDNPVAVRLPAILGFGVLCGCLYVFVARRCPRPYAWLAMLLPVASGAYPFAYEARAYGWVLGCCGAALVCWQAAAEGRPRGLALVGLSVSLAAAIASHYYAVLLFPPLVLGEAIRARARGTLDKSMGLALIVAATPLPFLYPLMREARAAAPAFWGQATWGAAAATYQVLLAPVLTPLIIGSILLLFWRGRRIRWRGKVAPAAGHMPLYERAAAVGFATVPLFGVLIGKAMTGVYVERYGLPAVAGLSVLIALAACRLGRGCPIRGGVLALTLLGWCAVTWWADFRRMESRLTEIDSACRRLEAACPGDRPIAVAHAHRFLQLEHYAPPELAMRLRYLSSRRESVHRLGHDTNERALQGLADVTPLPVVPYEEFVVAHQDFYVVGGERWLTRALRADGAALEVVSQDQGGFIFLAHHPPPPDGPTADGK